MIRKLVEHILIWLAASAVIVLGMSWAYSVGFTSHKTHLRIIAIVGATVVCVFAAALVQRSPAAVTLLVVLCTVLVGLGMAFLANGTRAVGVTYVMIGSMYVAALGPGCLRWLSSGRS